MDGGWEALSSPPASLLSLWPFPCLTWKPGPGEPLCGKEPQRLQEGRPVSLAWAASPPVSPPVRCLPAVTQTSCSPSRPHLPAGAGSSPGAPPCTWLHTQPGAQAWSRAFGPDIPSPLHLYPVSQQFLSPPVPLAPDPSHCRCLTLDPVDHARTLAGLAHPSSPSSCLDPAPNTNLAPAALRISPDPLHWPSPLSCAHHATVAPASGPLLRQVPHPGPCPPGSSSQGWGCLCHVHGALRSFRVSGTGERRGTQGTCYR